MTYEIHDVNVSSCLRGDFTEALTAAPQGCDAVLATGMMPAAAGARSVAAKLLIDAVSREGPSASAQR